MRRSQNAPDTQPPSWDYGRRVEVPRRSDVEDSVPLRNRQPLSVTEITDGIFTLKALEDLGEHLHLFETIEEADAWHGEDVAAGYSAYHYVVREFSEDVDEETPECNEVWVTGLDRASMQPIKVFYVDRASQDATLDPADRPDNWLGEPLIYAYYSSQLTSFEACERALKTIVPRVTNVRRIARVSADLLRWPDGRPVWRGDILAIQDRGYYEVKSFGGSIDRTAEARSVDGEDEDGGDATNFASMTYVMERLYAWDDA